MTEEREKSRGIKIYISPKVEERFRKAAMATYGYGKGALSQAGEAAFEHWSASAILVSSSEHKMYDPIKEIEGMLAHIKKSSVEVQHENSKIWANRTKHYKRGK
ncbi:hypothetical protein HZC07_04190 [Candidatus Micrarchaeota archaeon]|nr:hypothetical protein [Candidatus Micrarchaeota archaeon]